MLRAILVVIIGLLPLVVITSGCNGKKEPKELHFGPNPGDGEMEGDQEMKELHFGPNPGDG